MAHGWKQDFNDKDGGIKIQRSIFEKYTLVTDIDFSVHCHAAHNSNDNNNNNNNNNILKKNNVSLKRREQ